MGVKILQQGDFIPNLLKTEGGNVRFEETTNGPVVPVADFYGGTGPSVFLRARTSGLIDTPIPFTAMNARNSGTAGAVLKPGWYYRVVAIQLNVSGTASFRLRLRYVSPDSVTSDVELLNPFANPNVYTNFNNGPLAELTKISFGIRRPGLHDFSTAGTEQFQLLIDRQSGTGSANATAFITAVPIGATLP